MLSQFSLGEHFVIFGSPQITSRRKLCAVSLVSTVCFQMSPQTACPRGGIVALVAFVWLFKCVLKYPA